MTPTGAATWSIRTRTADGKQTRPKLGTWPAMGITDARKAALGALSAVQAGADPVKEKRAARAARKAEAAERSVADALAEWQAVKAADPQAPWSASYAAEVARVAERDIIPRLGKRKLARTTRPDWTALVSAKRKATPAMAAALYRILASFLGHAEAEGWIALPMLPRKGAAKLAPMPQARERVLTDAELAAVWHAADREPPKLRAFMRLLILTAARESEVADLSAGELDLEAGRWAIPGERTKNRAGYVVPLSPLALAELRAVWPAEDPGAEHMLLGRLAGSGFRGFSKLKARTDATLAAAAAKAGLPEPPGWRWHDLRRTARTGMTRLGVPRDHAEAAINHLSGRSKLERTYDRHDYAPEVIAALTLWQAHVAGLVGQAAELVNLSARRRPAAGK
jgi:integrase